MKTFYEENSFFILIVAIFLCFTYALPDTFKSVHSFNPTVYLSHLDLISRYAAAFLAIVFVKELIYHFHDGYDGLRTSARKTYTRYLRPERLFGFVLLMVLVPLYFYAYTTFKISTNQAKPFLYDHLLERIDSLVHAGDPPWMFLFPYLSNEQMTLALDKLYSQGWFISWISIFTWMAWTTKRELRWTFFANFSLAWILLGTYMANLLTSAGPCYFDKITRSFGPYQQLFDHLYAIHERLPLGALNGQNILWAVYQGGDFIQGKGISAMPSMHLSMMTTCTLGAWGLNRWVGGGYAILTIGILVGSVYLGWHYAIDGYVSILLTGVLWYLLAKIARRKFQTTKLSENS